MKRPIDFYNRNENANYNQPRINQELNRQQNNIYLDKRPRKNAVNNNNYTLYRTIRGYPIAYPNVYRNIETPNNVEFTKKIIANRVRMGKKGERFSNNFVNKQANQIIDKGLGHTLLVDNSNVNTYKGPSSSLNSFHNANAKSNKSFHSARGGKTKKYKRKRSYKR